LRREEPEIPAPDNRVFKMQFKAIVNSRSSSKRMGPPGEKEILKLNPKRREMILDKTGWNYLYPGTLNLTVDADMVIKLRAKKPDILEPGNSVKYPEAYQRIPLKRRSYLYFLGKISKNNQAEEVLFRVAEVPPRPDLIETFAPVRLRNTLSLKDGD
jgi:hypothetical protein